MQNLRSWTLHLKIFDLWSFYRVIFANNNSVTTCKWIHQKLNRQSMQCILDKIIVVISQNCNHLKLFQFIYNSPFSVPEMHIVIISTLLSEWSQRYIFQFLKFKDMQHRQGKETKIFHFWTLNVSREKNWQFRTFHENDGFTQNYPALVSSLRTRDKDGIWEFHIWSPSATFRNRG